MKKQFPVVCSICGEADNKLVAFEDGHICDPCLVKGRVGRDQTTRAARATRFGMQDEATASMARLHGDNSAANQYLSMATVQSAKAEALLTVDDFPDLSHGEAIPKRGLRLKDTMAAPDAVALDASAHRLELLDRLGTDCAAMALDAADSIQAENTMERMLAHQLAVAYMAALQMINKAVLHRDTVESARLINAAGRMMNTYQQGLLTLQRLRSNGEQHITVKHVTVVKGGQAIVGTVNQGGRGEK